MGYYHITLCPKSWKLCTIVLPLGKLENLNNSLLLNLRIKVVPKIAGDRSVEVEVD